MINMEANHNFISLKIMNELGVKVTYSGFVVFLGIGETVRGLVFSREYYYSLMALWRYAKICFP